MKWVNVSDKGMPRWVNIEQVFSIELDNVHQGYRWIIYGHGVADRSSHRFSESLHNYTYSKDFETVEEAINWLEEKIINI